MTEGSGGTGLKMSQCFFILKVKAGSDCMDAQANLVICVFIGQTRLKVVPFAIPELICLTVNVDVLPSH